MDGTPFGRYRLVELLGRGGMGEVWRAYDTTIGRVVALKVLPAHLADDETFQQRFRREARAAASLDEPHIVPIYDVGEIEDRLYVTMRLIAGRDMQDILADGPLEPARAISIIEQVASALNAAHRIGLVHRDVKPSNILVGEDDFAYLIDFGIARSTDETSRLTDTGNVIGTWAYLAPERLTQGEIEPQSDVYALACVLHECLTGSQPFPSNSLEQQIAAHLSMPPPRPSALRVELPAQLDPVIATGMAKDPRKRYSTTKELAQAARDAITDPIPRPFPGLGGPTQAIRDAQHTAPVVYPPQRPPAPPHWPVEPVEPARTLEPAPTVRVHNPVPPPVPEHTPLEHTPPANPLKTRHRRGVAIAAALAALTVIATVIAVGVTRHRSSSSAADDSVAPADVLVNTGPFTGVYRVDFGPDGESGDRGTATSGFNIRSACGPKGCVAVAVTSQPPVLAPKLVFDDVSGTWLAVSTSNGSPESVSPGLRGSCKDGDFTDIWEVFAVQPQPDGTLAGRYTAASEHSCHTTRTVTFTRTGDVDVAGVPDPEDETRRVTTPAERLRGQYRRTFTWPDNRDPTVSESSIDTNCLRTGDRCLSSLHGKNNAYSMIFAGGRWTWNTDRDYDCTPTQHTHNTGHAEYPLPPAASDPIVLLTGTGHSEVPPGTACSGSFDFQAKYERIGD